MDLTENFTLEEMCKSAYAIRQGIDNTPNEEQKENLRLLCINILQLLRNSIGIPVHIDSGFRNFEVNAAIGGAKTSQHTEGKAADITTAYYEPRKLADIIVKLGISFDQLILEFDEWVHISYNKDGNRNELLYATKIGGVTKYAPLQL
jgi:zinc D-Ala-D-Ala carboxypeptidase